MVILIPNQSSKLLELIKNISNIKEQIIYQVSQFYGQQVNYLSTTGNDIIINF
jgi:hypothetical protein